MFGGTQDAHEGEPQSALGKHGEPSEQALPVVVVSPRLFFTSVT